MLTPQEGSELPRIPQPRQSWEHVADPGQSLAAYQLARTKSLQIAYRKKELEFPRENTTRAGSIRNLGLLDKEADSKAILEASKKR